MKKLKTQELGAYLGYVPQDTGSSFPISVVDAVFLGRRPYMGFRQVIFILPPLAVLPLFWGKQGIWLAYPVADVVAVAISCILLLTSIKFYNRHKM